MVLEFLLGLDIVEYILLISSVVALIPTAPLISLYYRTRIGQYLIFMGVFLTSTLFAISSVLAQETNELFFWQLTFTARNLTYFLFFIHLLRMLWRVPPPLVLYPGVIGYSLVQFSIFFWQMNGDGIPGLFLPDGTDIYSSEHRLLGNLFQTFVAVLFLYGYYQIQVENPSPRVRNTKRIMMAMAVILLGSRLYRLAQNFGFRGSEGTEVFGNFLGRFLFC